MLTTVKRAAAAMGRELYPEEEFSLEMSIEAASEAIERHCNREFGLKTHTQRLDGSGTHFLRLRNYPVHSAAVKIRGKVIAADKYVIEAENGMLFRDTPWPEGERCVEVEYSAGYVLPSDDEGAHITLPRNIELACILYAQMLMTQTPGVASERVGDISVTYRAMTSGALPPAVAALVRM